MVTKSPFEGSRSTWVIFGQAMISSFGRGMQWKATLGELIPLRKQALIALHRKEAMVGWGDDFETSLWKEVDGEKWKEVERSGEKRREVVRISRWRQVLRGQLIEASLTCRKLEVTRLHAHIFCSNFFPA